VTEQLVRQILDEETAKIHDAVGDETWSAGRPEETRQIFEQVALSADLIEFLTLPAYAYLP
jgi:malate synthase